MPGWGQVHADDAAAGFMTATAPCQRSVRVRRDGMPWRRPRRARRRTRIDAHAGLRHEADRVHHAVELVARADDLGDRSAGCPGAPRSGRRAPAAAPSPATGRRCAGSSFIRSNPVSTNSAPASCAAFAMWNAIELSVMIPVTRMRFCLREDLPLCWAHIERSAEQRLSGSVTHAHTAVDGDHRAGDVAGVLRRQEADRAGDLSAVPTRLAGMKSGRPLGSARRAHGSSRCRCSRGHDVGGDPGLGHLARDRAGHADQPRLAAA